jgi:hypothetical protein
MNYSCFCGAVMKLVLVWTDTNDSAHELLLKIRNEIIRNGNSIGIDNRIHQHRNINLASSLPRKLRPIYLDARGGGGLVEAQSTDLVEGLVGQTKTLREEKDDISDEKNQKYGTEDLLNKKNQKECQIENEQKNLNINSKLERQKRWSTHTTGKDRKGTCISNIQVVGQHDVDGIESQEMSVGKSVSQMTLEDQMDIKLRMDRKMKHTKKLRLRHYQVRQKSSNSIKFFLSSSSSESESESDESENEKFQRYMRMEDNDRLWWHYQMMNEKRHRKLPSLTYS